MCRTDAQLWLFLAFAAAFAVKAGLFPLHSWVPDTYSEAPTAVVVLIAGVMAKTGAYGFVRFCLPLFPDAVQQADAVIGDPRGDRHPLLRLAGAGGHDIKRLLAYVSISHMGVIILGDLRAQRRRRVDGAVMQMVNHGIIIAALFLIAAPYRGAHGHAASWPTSVGWRSACPAG